MINVSLSSKLGNELKAVFSTSIVPNRVKLLTYVYTDNRYMRVTMMFAQPYIHITTLFRSAVHSKYKPVSLIDAYVFP